MSAPDNGGSAFPYSALAPDGPQMYADSEGMSLRDYFAAKAMQGFCGTLITAQEVYFDILANDAYTMADAMLKARAK